MGENDEEVLLERLEKPLELHQPCIFRIGKLESIIDGATSTLYLLVFL